MYVIDSECIGWSVFEPVALLLVVVDEEEDGCVVLLLVLVPLLVTIVDGMGELERECGLSDLTIGTVKR
jgi:hypothetical protein